MLLERVCLQLICRVWKKKRRGKKGFKKKSLQWSFFLRCSRKLLKFWRLTGYGNVPGEQQVVGNKTIAGENGSWLGWGKYREDQLLSGIGANWTFITLTPTPGKSQLSVKSVLKYLRSF